MIRHNTKAETRVRQADGTNFALSFPALHPIRNDILRVTAWRTPPNKDDVDHDIYITLHVSAGPTFLYIPHTRKSIGSDAWLRRVEPSPAHSVRLLIRPTLAQIFEQKSGTIGFI